MSEIIIVHLPINSDKNKIFATSENIPELIQKINEKRKLLEENDVEIFAQKYNIIVTEKGYYAAFYKTTIP